MTSRKSSAARPAARRSDKPFALRYFIICDDARFERNNKMMLVGVYGAEIMVASPDITLPKLSIVFSVEVRADELASTARFRLEAAGGGLVIPEGNFVLGNETPSATTSNIVVHLSAVHLPPDTYFARLFVNGVHEFAGEFRVVVGTPPATADP